MKERLTACIKTRTTKETKKAFEQLAEVRRLNPADLQREAFDKFIESNRALLPAKKGAK